MREFTRPTLSFSCILSVYLSWMSSMFNQVMKTKEGKTSCFSFLLWFLIPFSSHGYLFLFYEKHSSSLWCWFWWFILSSYVSFSLSLPLLFSHLLQVSRILLKMKNLLSNWVFSLVSLFSSSLLSSSPWSQKLECWVSSFLAFLVFSPHESLGILEEYFSPAVSKMKYMQHRREGDFQGFTLLLYFFDVGLSSLALLFGIKLRQLPASHELDEVPVSVFRVLSREVADDCWEEGWGEDVSFDSLVRLQLRWPEQFFKWLKFLLISCKEPKSRVKTRFFSWTTMKMEGMFNWDSSVNPSRKKDKETVIGSQYQDYKERVKQQERR